MKRLPVVILLVVALLVTVVAGCGGMRRHDARLTAADSLMQSDPDSALAIVEGVCRDSLASEGDRAYRDLLLTQARYRCYIPATSDSDISRALAWYRAHDSEREKLTRALIYKGAVMEELSRPDSAMLYYKQAEATAAPDDYFNLGYVKMRIATLYHEQISQDSAAIIRLKDAIYYFKTLNDTNYLISCYGDLGAICGITYPDSTEIYLSTAIRLAQEINSPKRYIYMSKLAGFNLYYKKDFRKTIALAESIINNGKEECEENQYYYYAALAALNLGLADSAKYYISQAPAPNDTVETMLFNDVMAQISLNEQDYKSFGIIESKNKQLSSDFIDGLKEADLIKAEADYEHKQSVEEKAKANIQRNRLTIMFIAALSLSLILLIIIYKLRQILNKHQLEKSEIKKDLEKTLVILAEEQSKYKQENTVSQLVRYRISAMTELYKSIRVRLNDENQNRIKKVIPLSALLELINEKYQLLNLKLSDSFWRNMRKSVDGELNGIVTFVEKKYENLSEDDIKLFTLYCARVSPQIISLCMNFSHTKTASNYKRKILKSKMRIDMSFDQFIEEYLQGNID